MWWNIAFIKNKRRTIVIYLIFLFVILYFVFSFGIFRVNGNSMKPNLYNDNIVLYKKNNFNLDYFDIVVVEVDGKKYIKRIIGLSGDKVQFKDNILFLNNKKIKEPFERNSTDDFSIKVGKNQILVLGDNRPYSYDGRNFGAVSINKVKGKIVAKI